jgi:hypothetical protein
MRVIKPNWVEHATGELEQAAQKDASSKTRRADVPTRSGYDQN